MRCLLFVEYSGLFCRNTSRIWTICGPRWRTLQNLPGSTANIYTYTPIIWNTVCIILIHWGPHDVSHLSRGLEKNTNDSLRQFGCADYDDDSDF